MEHHIMRQLRGAKDLTQDAVAATVNALAEAHQDIAHAPYAVLGRIPKGQLPAGRGLAANRRPAQRDRSHHLPGQPGLGPRGVGVSLLLGLGKRVRLSVRWSHSGPERGLRLRRHLGRHREHPHPGWPHPQAGPGGLQLRSRGLPASVAHDRARWPAGFDLHPLRRARCPHQPPCHHQRGAPDVRSLRWPGSG